MKSVCAILMVLAAVFTGAFTSPLGEGHAQLLGTKRCTWGPSYWCGNLINAKGCNAVSHCIQTVWEKHQVPVDTDSICKICKDMVTQARDQLRSNETMEELKEVFEGSCNLIPIKPIKKECCKLADDFIPELVEALTSQMNPDQVCSVAGLCNNAEIDKMLMDYYQSALDGTLVEENSNEATTTVKSPTKSTTRPLLGCNKCNSIAGTITQKFAAANRDDVLENFLHLCGQMSSFSDACANIVLTYFNDIYDHVKANLNSEGICHLSGVCSDRYHQHPEDEQKQQEELVAAAAPGDDDIPCELCQQLIHHLRDILTANTTEAEFKQVLEGLCGQTKTFKPECMSIVDQYYDVIYQTLVNNLDANGACFMIGICPKPASALSSSSAEWGTAEIRPLLPVFPPAEIKVTIRKKLGANEPKFTQEEIQQMAALPIDHLMGAANPMQLVNNGETCTLCEYLLHFIQDALATPATEEKIKKEVNYVCDRIPSSVRGECHNFIDMYADAVIALLIQGLNPRSVCPMMKLCPTHGYDFNDMEVIAPSGSQPEFKDLDESDKPTCPLCLFAVEQAQEKIKNDKSKKNIQNVLDHLCTHLPKKLQAECVDFVETYSNELIDMLITDFKPQEICVAIKLCPKANNYLSDLGISIEDEDKSSSEESEVFNEVDSDDASVLPIEIVFEPHEESAPNCLLCEELVKMAEKKMGKHTTKEEIKDDLEHACDRLKLNLRGKCHKIVDKYGDEIANLLLKQMAPKVICTELGMCLGGGMHYDLDIDEALKYDVVALPSQQVNRLRPYDRLTGIDDLMIVNETPSCVLCEFVMTKLETELKDKNTQAEIKQTVENICNHMPKTVAKNCDKFVEEYADAVITLIGSVPPKQICQKLMLCLSTIESTVTDEVIECGICHGATASLVPYLKNLGKLSGISTREMYAPACGDLPGKYYEKCQQMISVYGPSFVNLVKSGNQNESQICSEIGKCFAEENSSLAFAKLTA